MSTPLEKLILSLLLITRLRQGFGEQALVMAGVFGAACLRRQGQGGVCTYGAVRIKT